jgi:hypothetical protein
VRQSNTAIKWLSYIAEREGIHIEHVRNGGEKRFGKYSLDGYHEESNTAYEFQGCLWHGKWNRLLGVRVVLSFFHKELPSFRMYVVL